MTRPDSPAEREALARKISNALRSCEWTDGAFFEALNAEEWETILDALRSLRPSEQEVARAANLIGKHVYAMDGHRTIAGLTEAARAVLALFTPAREDARAAGD